MSAATGVPLTSSPNDANEDAAYEPTHDELYYQEMYAFIQQANNGIALSAKKQVTSKFGGTDLHTYATQKAWTKLLAAAKAEKFFILDQDHRTPLHIAIQNGADDACLLELIRLAPFQVRIVDLLGKDTPMHVACEEGVGLIVMYSLLEADRTIVQRQNRTTTGKKKDRVLYQKNAAGRTPMALLRLHENANLPHNVFNNNEDDYDTAAPLSFGRIFQSVRKVASSLTNLPWKYHVDEFEGVLQAVEEEMEAHAAIANEAM